MAQTMSRCSLGNHAGFHPCTPQGPLALDPFADVVELSNRQFPATTCKKSEPLRMECGTSVHARTRLRKKTITLRIGCGTATHGLGGVPPPAGCFSIRGKHEKGRWESLLSQPTFFNVFIAPVAETAWFFQATCGNNCFRYILLSRRKGAGRIALPQGYRGRVAPCFVVPSSSARIQLP